MTDSQGEKPKFDQEAWSKAYNEAEDLPGDPFSKEGMQKIIDEAGIPMRVSSMEELEVAEKRKEYDRQNLVAAELGDETVIRVKGENRDRYYDLADINSWRVLIHLVEAYKRFGDTDSVDKLLAIFPSHSQLQAEIEKRITRVEVDPNDEGFDVREGMGSVMSVENGTQYDMLPGSVDFRKFVQDGQLNIDDFVKALFEDQKQRDQGYAQDWDEINHTLNNVKKEFGERIKEEVWKKFEEKYRDYQDRKVMHNNG